MREPRWSFNSIAHAHASTFALAYWHVLKTFCNEAVVRCSVFQNPDEGHFDNVASSLLLLFEISTMEMWPTTLYNVVDGTEPGLQPERDKHQGTERSVSGALRLVWCPWKHWFSFLGSSYTY